MSAIEIARRLDVRTAVSGETLAAELGISRAAVWKRIEALRAAGLGVVAEGGRGYRLEEAVEWLDAGRINDDLAARRARHALRVRIHDEVDSTMVEVGRAASEGAPTGTACLAEHQRTGRGRRGRAWVSPLGANLYLSLLWRFGGGLGALAGLNLAIGVALREALAEVGVRGAALKWPNDVVVGRRKLAGVLVEAGGQWHGPCHAVIGVGVNWCMRDAVGAGIDQPWTDVRREAGVPVSRNTGAAAVLDALHTTLEEFAQSGAAAIVERWHAHDALRGRAVLVHEPHATWRGIAHAVDASGCLLVDREGAGRVAVAAGEVSVRAVT
jgi:BirA family biotin operon repressor/biotin-[acetyl-CoA-carboxylase] ligase